MCLILVGAMPVSPSGLSSDIRASAWLTVTGQTRTISGEERAFVSAAVVGAAK